MASLPYPLNQQDNPGRVGMAGMPYPPTDCHSYIKINMTTYLYNRSGGVDTVYISIKKVSHSYECDTFFVGSRHFDRKIDTLFERKTLNLQNQMNQ